MLDTCNPARVAMFLSLTKWYSKEPLEIIVQDHEKQVQQTWVPASITQETEVFFCASGSIYWASTQVHK